MSNTVFAIRDRGPHSDPGLNSYAERIVLRALESQAGVVSPASEVPHESSGSVGHAEGIAAAIELTKKAIELLPLQTRMMAINWIASGEESSLFRLEQALTAPELAEWRAAVKAQLALESGA